MEAVSKRVKANDANWLKALAGPQQWRPSDARRVFEALASSGMTLAEFADEHGINPQRIVWWEKRLATMEAAPPASTALQFAAVTLKAAPRPLPSAERCAVVVLTLPRGVRVEVMEPDGVSPTWLAAVISALAFPRGVE